ncbi:hypothetical protein CFOL_v3_00865 [Cephalotus follicularis]|uniref:Uncharacterized protein n=1 Tax=Cephalotus follicularis TaxID=3775 RepID=A0A1Q3ANJ8_CEPFO|nr:hypothetical protein CFOL_v3_00865 [Cephalotus follicularis]
MSGLSKVATALTVVFAVSLVILVCDLIYVLWRRRGFWERGMAGEDSEFPGNSFHAPSKELLYFFCWKNQCRIEPAAAAVAPHPPIPVEEEEDDELAKWQAYGPSRVLFTIREEADEREGLESESCCTSFDENGTRAKRVRLNDCFEDKVVLPQSSSQVVVDIEVDQATPFSTPCGSPQYYTPSPSPSRFDDTDSENSVENDEGRCENERSFVSIQIHYAN